MFHPRGPNFLLSWTRAWKNERPKNSFFHSATLSPDSNLFFYERPSYVAKDISILLRIPFGGALERILPICRILYGNESSGIEVSHSLNLWFSFGLKSGLYSLSIIFSTTLSRTGRKAFGDKWQFSRTTHPPSSKHALIVFLASGPYPIPSDIVCGIIPFWSPNLFISVNGLTPADIMKMKGVL